MIEVRLKTDKDKYSSNNAIKYVVQLGELKSYLTEKALIELRTKLNTFAIPVVIVPKGTLCEHAYGENGCYMMDNNKSCTPYPKESEC